MDEYLNCEDCNNDLNPIDLFEEDFDDDCLSRRKGLTYTVRTIYNFTCPNETLSSILVNLSCNSINVVSINLNAVTASTTNVKLTIGSINKEIPCQKTTFEQMLRDYGVSYGKGCCIQIVTGLTQKITANLYKILSPTCGVKNMEYGLNNTLFISCCNMKLADQLVSCFATRV